MLNINAVAFPQYRSFAQIWGFMFCFDHMHLFILFTYIAPMSDDTKGFHLYIYRKKVGSEWVAVNAQIYVFLFSKLLKYLFATKKWSVYIFGFLGANNDYKIHLIVKKGWKFLNKLSSPPVFGVIFWLQLNDWFSGIPCSLILSVHVMFLIKWLSTLILWKICLVKLLFEIDDSMISQCFIPIQCI